MRTPGSFDFGSETLMGSCMEPESYVLQLNRTHLLFIPPLDLAYDPNSTSGSVVQVCLRGDDGDGYMRSLLTSEGY